MKNLVVLVLVVLAGLAGCASPVTKEIDTAAIATSPKVEIKFDKRLLAECEPLIESTSSREEDVKMWISDTSGKYLRCALLKRKENAEIKKALNIKD